VNFLINLFFLSGMFLFCLKIKSNLVEDKIRSIKLIYIPEYHKSYLNFFLIYTS
ncbi:hypothetical protein Avbf_13597, partial [Armadillidium vulgare]